MDEENVDRTVEDVNDMLELAKMSENDILATSQILYFDDKFADKTNCILMELDPNLIETIEKGEDMFFKGKDDENIVLCTKNKTYNVLGAETSNSFLMLENLKLRDEIKTNDTRNLNKVTVKGIFHEYLEPVSSKGHLQNLSKLLEKSVYKGPEHEFEIKDSDLYTYDNLLDNVQASELELDDALKELKVVTVENKIRLLDVEYHFRILSYMLKLIDENSWSLDEINYQVTMSSLNDLAPEKVINALFDIYTVESKMIDSEQLYKYDENKVCKFFAQILLQTAGRFSLNEFLQAWKESVPEGMTPSEEMLYGIALIDLNSTPKSIKAFTEDNLPDDIMERFNALFEAKEKWTVPEIAPYIKKLTTDKLNVNALLAKYARASNKNGVKYYSAKHSK